jgi:DNA-binding Lrp family transcriptional regulator
LQADGTQTYAEISAAVTSPSAVNDRLKRLRAEGHPPHDRRHRLTALGLSLLAFVLVAVNSRRARGGSARP